MIQQINKKNENRREEDIYNKWKDGYRLEEIGKEYNITRERVRQIKNKFLNKKLQKILNDGFKMDSSEFFAYENKKHLQNSKIIHPPKIYKKTPKRWSPYYDKCVVCGTNLINHHSHGYCRKCYKKSDIFREIQNKSRCKKGLVTIDDRLKILEKYEYKCCDCGMTQKDHINKYGKDLYVVSTKKNNNDLENLILRCIKCHFKKLEKIKKRIAKTTK